MIRKRHKFSRNKTGNWIVRIWLFGLRKSLPMDNAAPGFSWGGCESRLCAVIKNDKHRLNKAWNVDRSDCTWYAIRQSITWQHLWNHQSENAILFRRGKGKNESVKQLRPLWLSRYVICSAKHLAWNTNTKNTVKNRMQKVSVTL